MFFEMLAVTPNIIVIEINPQITQLCKVGLLFIFVVDIHFKLLLKHLLITIILYME